MLHALLLTVKKKKHNAVVSRSFSSPLLLFTMSKCPRCNNEASGQNRLVTDSCGHTKCRQCLLADVSDCLECKTASSVEIPQEQAAPATVSSNHITITEHGYHCTVCNKSFRSRTQQYYHRGCGNELLKKYKCTQCSRRFATLSHLKYHLNNHGSRSGFACPVCGKSFKQQTVMQRHLLAHKYEPQICCHCQREFRSQSALKTHSGCGLPSYKCDICSKCYLTKANLKQHQLKHDQQSPRHSCHICAKTFVRHSTLKQHLKRHGKRERYNCPHCHKSYSDIDALARHTKLHSKATDKYRCLHCDITVNRRDNMKRHMRAMHAGVTFEDGVEIISAEEAAEEAAAVEETESPAETVRYSSVIKSVGNVEPVKLPTPMLEPDPEPEPAIAVSTLCDEMQKQNVKLYRKIILDLDNEEYSNEMMPAELHDEHVIEQDSTMQDQQQQHQQQQRGHGSSNFSEMHWRKNFKYSYENEHTN